MAVTTAALNKLATAYNQKVILTKFDLTVFLAQPNRAANRGNNIAMRLRIVRKAGDEERLHYPRSRRERDHLLRCSRRAAEQQYRCCESGQKRGSPGYQFYLCDLTIDILSKRYFFTDLYAASMLTPRRSWPMPSRHIQAS